MGDERTGGEQEPRRSGRWGPGQSGNPAGRPRGSRNKVTQVCADLLADASGDIMARLIKEAKKGDGVALKLCVERLVPVRAARDRFVDVELPAVAKAQDLVAAAAAVIDGVASGRMTVSEGRDFMALLEGERKLIETSDLLVRIEALEGGVGERPAAASPALGGLDGERFEGTLARELAARVRVLDRGGDER